MHARSNAPESPAANAVVIPEDDEDDSSEDDGEGWTSFSDFSDRRTQMTIDGEGNRLAK